jgi:gliding motility-associated-like protein
MKNYSSSFKSAGITLLIMFLGLFSELVAAGFPVTNQRTNATGATIQAILDDPLTLDGDVILVDLSAGYVTEANVDVSKQVTLQGVNGVATLTQLTLSNANIVVTNLTVPSVIVNAGATVQEAVNAVSASGSVNISAGTYAENVTVNKALTITGSGGVTVSSFILSNKIVAINNVTVNTIDVLSGASVQDAVSAINTGGTVNVNAGTFAESITLSKAMTLNGIGSPVINAITLTNQSATVSGVVLNTVNVQGTALVQDGVNLVKSGGVLNINTGVYPENVTVAKAMTINGIGAVSVNTFNLSNQKVPINNVTVTTNTVNVVAGGSIQDGINAVGNTGTVNVGAGNYLENISLINAVQVVGAGAPTVRGIQFVDPLATITGFGKAPDSIYVKNALQLQKAIDFVKDSGVVFIDSNYYAGKYTVTNKNIKFNSYPKPKVPILQALTINNTMGRVVTMAGQVKIEDSLNLTFGMVTTSGLNTFLLLDQALVSKGNDSTFINGPLMKESKSLGSRTFEFPVGKIKLGVRLVDLKINQTANTLLPGKDSVVYTVEYKTDGKTQISTIPNQPFHPGWYPPTYWFIDNGGYKFFDNPKVSLHFRSNDVAAYLLNNKLGFGVAKTQGPNWSDLKQDTMSTGNPFLDTTGVITSLEVFKSFGDVPVTFFAIGPYQNCTTSNVQPQANFSFSNICENTMATFVNKSSIKRGSIVMFKWEVFDDTVGVGSDAVLNGYYARIDTGHFVSPVNKPGPSFGHTFKNVGTYKVILTAMSDTGCVQTNEQFIKVVPTPVMTYVSSPEGICNQKTATFKVNVQSVPTNETWNFGYSVSGTSVAVPAQNVTGKGSGTFTVTTPVLDGATKATLTLNTITNATNSASPACSTISNVGVDVMLVPKPTFTAPTVCLDIPTVFTNTTSAANSKSPTYLWDFADSTSANVAIQKHTYKKSGTYLAKLVINSGNGCVDSVSQNVVVNALPVVVFTPAKPILPSTGNVAVSVTAASSYLWNTAAITQVLSADTAGKYSVTITDANGCKGNGDVIVNPYTPSFEALSVCLGNDMTFKNTTVTKNIHNATYTWNFGDTTITTGLVVKHKFKKAGTFSVKLIVKSSNGLFVDSVSQNVTVFDLPVVVFTPAAPVLPSNSAGKVAVSVTASTSYLWNTGETNQVLLADTAGVYSVSITDVNTCVNKGKVTVKAYKPSFTSPAVCDKKAMTFTNTTSEANTNFPTYRWDFGDNTNFAYGPTVKHTYDKPGTYRATLLVETGINNRKDTVSNLVTVYALPVVTFNPTEPYVEKGNSTQITTNANMDSYLWKIISAYRPIQDSTKQTVTVNAVGFYSVTITDTNACVNTDTVQVLEEAIIIANTLTPNGDGYNDTWWIDKIAAHPDCKVVIVNRYGDQVYTSQPYNNDWGGTFKGSILPDGAYYYVVTCDSIEKIYKGHVNILKGK